MSGDSFSERRDTLDSKESFMAPSQPYDATSAEPEKWMNARKYQDTWAACLFYIQFIAFIVIAAFSISKAVSYSNEDTDGDIISDNGKLAGFIIMNIATITVLSVLYLVLFCKFITGMIHVGMIVNIIALGAAFIFFAFTFWYFAIFFAIGAVFFVAFYIGARKRIPFATFILQTTIDVNTKFNWTIGVVSLFLTVGLVILCLAAAHGAAYAFADNQSSLAVIVFLIFSTYWTTQAIKGMLNTTVSGVFATFYFFGHPSTNSKIDLPVKSPGLQALKRSTTTSLGSIAFGSLVIAILQIIRFVIRVVTFNTVSGQNAPTRFCFFCADYLCGCIEAVFGYFNRYAYTQIAVYGKSYCDASSSTFKLLKETGVDMLINDGLITAALRAGGIVVSVLNIIIGVIYIGSVDGIYTCKEGRECSALWDELYLIILFGFFAYYAFRSLTEVVESGVSTTFVCLAEAPRTIQRTKPEFYQKLIETYPDMTLRRV